jgi:hypothetical protein
VNFLKKSAGVAKPFLEAPNADARIGAGIDMSNEYLGLALLGLGLFLFVVMVIGLLLAPSPSQATPEISLKLHPSPPALRHGL